MNRAVSFKIVLTQLGLVACVLGCNAKGDLNVKQNEVLEKSESLNRCYLAAHLVDAERCLKDNVKLLENAAFLEPIGRSQLLSLAYARLFVLQTRRGDKTAAEASFIGAKYWTIKRMELEARDPEVAMKEVQSQDADHLRILIDSIDREHNHGNLPAYVGDTSSALP